MAEDLSALLARVQAPCRGWPACPMRRASAGARRRRGAVGRGRAQARPTFRTSNEKDPSGAAVVRADAARRGRRRRRLARRDSGIYTPDVRRVDEQRESGADALDVVRSYLVGPGRPPIRASGGSDRGGGVGSGEGGRCRCSWGRRRKRARFSGPRSVIMAREWRGRRTDMPSTRCTAAPATMRPSRFRRGNAPAMPARWAKVLRDAGHRAWAGDRRLMRSK